MLAAYFWHCPPIIPSGAKGSFLGTNMETNKPK